jgi:hypothetical protein
MQVKLPPDPKPEGKVPCSQCGDSDTFEHVKRSLGEQAQEFAARQIQKTLGDAFRGNKPVKYTPGIVPKRSHRFIVKLPKLQIPFARSNYFNDLAHRCMLAPGKIPSTVRTVFSTFSRVALHVLAEQRILFHHRSHNLKVV